MGANIENEVKLIDKATYGKDNRVPISTALNKLCDPGSSNFKYRLTEQDEYDTIPVHSNTTGYLIYHVPKNIYGVSWNGGESPTLTRTDNAADFDEPDPYVADGSHPGYSPFDNVMPWAGIECVTINGNEMVKIPKFWFKVTKTGDAMTFQIADGPAEGFLVSPAHMDRGDGKGERDYVYVGRYHSGSDYTSKTGVMPRNDTYIDDARTGIRDLGDGFHMFDFSLFWTTRLLYIVEMANFDAQAVIGYGRGNNSGPVNVGYTDTMPYHTGTVKEYRTAYGAGTQYRYMEGLWDSLENVCDGVRFSEANMYAFLNPADYETSSGGTLIGTRPTSAGYIKALTGSSVAGFEWVWFPSDTTGSESHYLTDLYDYSSYGGFLCVGGNFYKYQNQGMFSFSTYYSGSSYNVGYRIQYLP